MAHADTKKKRVLTLTALLITICALCFAGGGTGELDPYLVNDPAPTLGANLNANGKTITSATRLGVTSTATTESAVLGDELVDGTGWTLGAGWSGDYVTGFTHTAGGGNLSRSIGATGTNMYEVSFTISTTEWAVEVTLGNSVGFPIYKGGSAPITYTAGIKSVSDGDLVFNADPSFDGTITNISVKQITGTYAPSIVITNSTGTSNLEIRSSTDTLFNQFIGTGAGQYNTSGFKNIALGNRSLEYNTSGFWNTALGYITLGVNTTGSRNVALGQSALKSNISGHRNIGVGSFALQQNTYGNYNIGIGADALYDNTTGSDNTAIGYTALDNNVDGDHNIAVGFLALGANVSGDSNVAIGYLAGNACLGSGNVFIGKNAGYFETGSNKLYIDNTNTASPLIYGDFDTNALTVNGTLNATGATTVGGSFTTTGKGSFTDFLGAGVAAPAAALHVRDNIALQTSLGDFDNYQVVITGGSGTDVGTGILLCSAEDGYGGSAILHYDKGSGGIGDLVFFTKQAGTVTAPVEVMRLDYLGNMTFANGADITTSGTIQGGSYKSSDGTAGWTGSFTNGDGNTVTVKNGLITAVTTP